MAKKTETRKKTKKALRSVSAAELGQVAGGGGGGGGGIPGNYTSSSGGGGCAAYN